MNNQKYPNCFDLYIPYFEGFMRRFSKQSYPRRRNKLLAFTLFLISRYKIGILDANIEQILDFFKNDVNKRDILRESKNAYRNVLNSYYDYIKELIEKKMRIPFINPVPSMNLFDFDEKDLPFEELEKKEDILESYEQVERILNYLYITKRRLFIIVSLLLYTGARISEIVSINLDFIDYEERFFYVKVKSKKSLNRWGVYFFPKFFVKELKEWVEHIKLEYPNAIYLFQMQNSHISTKTIRKNLRDVKSELGITYAINPHAFRDFINTERFDKELNRKYRKLLLNQTPKDVNVKNYLKKYKKRRNLLKIYDQTLPFPEFKPKIKKLF